MLWILITLTYLCIVCTSVNGAEAVQPPNHILTPPLVILNSTSRTKFICTKRIDDQLGFQVTLNPNISSEKILWQTRQLNNTAIEIELQSLGYIGAFIMICAGVNRSSAGTASDVIIGAPPGLVTREERCVVAHNSYIDCKIRAPVIVAAIHNRYSHQFSFNEIHPPSEASVYISPPQFIEINDQNGTMIVRWFPTEKQTFPSGVKMSIYASMRFFGSSNYTMDMTPNFWVKPNFTVIALPSANLNISLHPWDFSSPPLCHGNITRDEPSRSNYEEENFKTLIDSRQSSFEVTRLSPRTWYRVCLRCRLDLPVDSISELQCARIRTKSNLSNGFLIGTVLGSLLLIIFAIAGCIYAKPRVVPMCQRCLKKKSGKKEGTIDTVDGRPAIQLNQLSQQDQEALLRDTRTLHIQNT